MRKFSFILAFVIAFGLLIQVTAFSSPTPAPGTCQSGAYPVSNSFSRGIQRVLGLNVLTTWVAESAIKNQISKLIQKGKVDVDVKAYSAGDLIAGKVKGFEITGKNIVFNDMYISSLKAQSLCDFTSFNYRSTPAVLNSPLFIKYNAEITNDGLNKIFSSDSVKTALSGIEIKINDTNFGEVDFTDLKTAVKKEKINIKANLVYKRAIFTFKFPINFDTALKVKDNKIYLTNIKFGSDAANNEFRFITNFIELNNIKVFDLNTLEKDGSEINIKNLKIVNDKIVQEGTFWQPQNTTL